MSGDIRALTALNSMPLVREKRHYPGEQKNNQQTKNQQQESPENQEHADDPHRADTLNSDENDAVSSAEQQLADLKAGQKNKVDPEGKNVTVMHIDEYA